MTLAEKILQLIQQSEFKNLTAFHKAIEEYFGEAAITYKTLIRTVHGETEVRENSLFQIASLLGKKTAEIREGTDSEISEKNSALDTYKYNDKAELTKLNKNLPFSPQKITIKPGGQTTPEQDPPKKGEFIKWVNILFGEVSLIIERKLDIETKLLKREDCYCFDSTQLHHFENHSAKHVAKILLIHYPNIL
jgi:hypothetical protein